MKALTMFCALMVIAVGVLLISAYIESNDIFGKSEVEKIYLDENKPISGMFFSSEYVTEEYEYDDAYCIRYDDADANLFDAEIFVDHSTYENVIESIKSGRRMVGSLVLNDSLSCHCQPVFTFVPNL